MRRMKRIKEFFLLKDDAFFDMLFNLAECAHGCAGEFDRFLQDFETLDAGQKGMRLRTLNGYEKDGDVLVRTISEELYRHFITPIDREDIHALASNLDTSIDLMEDIGKKLLYYRLDAATPIMKTQSGIVKLQVKEIRTAIERMKKSQDVTTEYRKVFELEDQADFIYEKAMTELFDPSNEELAANPLNVIKLKDLYDELEDLVDLNQRLAMVIEGIVIKHV
ncbi:DUF47 family protein [Candidatus Micrarchaeota archaeon]|nr:DUF47 family protein [Candidatus Micrarchaeota archaeon]